MKLEKEIEKLKKEIECFKIEDLCEIIRSEPLIDGKTHIELLGKRQKQVLRNKLLEIAKQVLELSYIESKFLEDKLKNNFRKIEIEAENYDELFKKIDELDIDKDVKRKMKMGLYGLFNK